MRGAISVRGVGLLAGVSGTGDRSPVTDQERAPRTLLPLVVLLTTLIPAGTGAQGIEPDPSERRTGAVVDPDVAPRPVAHAYRLTAERGGVRVDGVLDEASWRRAEPITGFVQAVPETGAPATERTEVRVVYDARNLYVGAVLHQSVPLVVPSLVQDFETHDSDVLGIAVDTYLDRRNSFMFLVNPAGAVKDGQTFNDSRDLNLAWEGVVHIETVTSDTAWIVEMAIPLTTLRFDPAVEQSWGLQLLRRIRRKNEDVYWAPVDRRDRLHKMSRAGTLRGLRGLRQGRNLSVKPYGKVGDARGTEAVTGTSADVGVDLKWGLTPGLTLDLTYRTDFSQVEVDQERVNLTRFSLFFPERRDFFIENAGVFTFGDVTERNYRMGSSLRDFTLFHSRRIGLEGGEVVPILAGGRLTGTVGPFQVGVLDIQTQPGQGHLYPGPFFGTTGDAPAPAENTLVARLRRNLFGSSDVGVMVVNRQVTDGPTAGHYNRSYGADANVRLFTNLIVNTYVAAVDEPGPDPRNGAGRLSAAWRGPLWDISAFYKHVGSGFAPAAGFVRRAGIREAYATVGAHPRVGLPGVYALNPYMELDYVAERDGGLATREAAVGLGVAFLDGGSLSVVGRQRYDRLEGAFDIADDVTIAAGTYAFDEASVVYRASGGRPFSGSLRLTTGEFYDGTRTSVGLGALWRVSPHLALDLSLDRNAVSLPAGAFDADVARARVNVAVSRALLASALVQYNAATDQMISNARLNYIHAPLSDLFLVFVERRDVANGTVLDRSVALKMTKLLSL